MVLFLKGRVEQHVVQKVYLHFALLLIVLVSKTLNCFRLSLFVERTKLTRSKILWVDAEHCAEGSGFVSNFVSLKHRSKNSGTFPDSARVGRH